MIRLMAQTKACPSCGNQIPGDARFCPQCGTAAGAALRRLRTGQRSGIALLRAMRRETWRSPGRSSLPCAACGSGRAAGRARRHRGRTPPAHGDVLRSGRLDGAVDAARSGRFARSDRRLSQSHGRRGHPPRRLCRQIYGRRRAGLFRLSGSARGRRRERGARGPRCWSMQWQNCSRDGRHQVRIGIATGLVVVGELVGSGEAQERNVVGETPNLAARLQSAAAPNTVDDRSDDAAARRRALRISRKSSRRRSRALPSRSAPGAWCASAPSRAGSRRCARQASRR